MKTMLAFLLAGSFLVTPDLWWEDQVATIIRDFQMAVDEPVPGEPARVSRLRNELAQNWERLLGPKLVLDLEEEH